MNNKLRILIVFVVAILQLCAAIIMVVYSDNSGVSGNSPYDVVFDNNRYYQLSRAERTALCIGIQAGQIECTAPVPGGAERLIMMDRMRFFSYVRFFGKLPIIFESGFGNRNTV